MTEKTLRLGDYNTLRIVRETPQGMYLDGGSPGEILLPSKYVTPEMKPETEVTVFLYLDQKERLVATTETPLAKVGDFAYLEVSWINKYGAFLKWGLLKDLFCPFREQKEKMKIGEKHLVYIYIDKQTYRIVASAKIEKFIEKTPPTYAPDTPVPLLIWTQTAMGYKAIIQNRWQGLLYKDHIYKDIRPGDQCTGYIQAVRPDGKIDLALQPTGRKQTEDFTMTLMQYLQEHDGYCDLDDSSDPELIKKRFAVSKKVYKKAIGALYKDRIIRIEQKGIRLAQNSTNNTPHSD